MKRFFHLRVAASVILLSMTVSVTKAQSVVFNTVTGKSTGESSSSAAATSSASASSGATVCVDNGWSGNMISAIGYGMSNYYAQSFTATVSTITKIGIVIQQLSAAGEVRFGIAENNGGVPNYAAPLYLGSIITPTTTAQWYYEEGLNIPVTVGNKYFIFIDGYNISGASGYSGIGYSNTQPISGEGIVWSNDGGTSWSTMSVYPLAIYVEGGSSSPVPVPIWAIALAFVVIGTATVIGIRRKMAKQVA